MPNSPVPDPSPDAHSVLRENEELLAVVRAQETPLPHLEAALLNKPWQQLPFRIRENLANLYAHSKGDRGTPEYTRARQEYTFSDSI